MPSINLFDLFAKISLDTSDYDKGVEDAGKKGKSLASTLKSGLASAGKMAATGLAAIGTAAGAAVGGLLALESSTEEYRIAMGKLNTAFESAGYSADTAKEAYNAFYGILGDTDTATEASQLLAKLAENEEDVATWTNIAAGVAGTFGDSLPIESLIEASNETAKVGTVTGTLADALNWAGISEDAFNEKLAACSTESERNRLIMDTLSGTYDEASAAFYRNNEALVQSRENQAKLDATLATLGQTVSDVKNRLLSEFLPSISNVAVAFSAMIAGASGADIAFSEAVQEMVNAAVSKLPEFLNFGVQILSSLAGGIIQSIPSVVSAVPKIISAIGAAIIALIPQIISMGGQVLSQFTAGIESGMPDMLSRLPIVISGILDFVTENLPAFLEKGIEILTNLYTGILNTIPEMVAALPQIITAIISFVTENLPIIINAGIDLLISLTKGIIGAIPQLVKQLPQIISAITNGLADSFPKIVKSGVELLGKLIDGILSNIPALVSALPEIINAIIDGIGSLMGGIVDVGKAIIEGLWEGIKAKITWLKDKVSGVVGTIKGWFTGKDGFDEHSPSKWANQVFRYVMEGGGEGLEAGLPGLMADTRKVVDGFKNGLDFGTANVDFASSGLGRASAATINAAAGNGGQAIDLTANLVLPDGRVLASFLFSDLVNFARANGTPIVNPT